MTKLNLKKLLLVLVFVQVIAGALGYTPVLIWGAKCASKPALQVVETSDFANVVDKLLEDHMVVVLLANKLKPSDFLCRQSANNSKSCFEFLKNVEPKTYYAAVDQPAMVFKDLNVSITHITIDDCIPGSYGLYRFNQCKLGTILLIEFKNSCTQERSLQLQQHDRFIEQLMQWQAKDCPVAYMYMSATLGETKKQHRHVKRESASTELQHLPPQANLYTDPSQLPETPAQPSLQIKPLDLPKILPRPSLQTKPIQLPKSLPRPSLQTKPMQPTQSQQRPLPSPRLQTEPEEPPQKESEESANNQENLAKSPKPLQHGHVMIYLNNCKFQGKESTFNSMTTELKDNRHIQAKLAGSHEMVIDIHVLTYDYRIEKLTIDQVVYLIKPAVKAPKKLAYVKKAFKATAEDGKEFTCGVFQIEVFKEELIDGKQAKFSDAWYADAFFTGGMLMGYFVSAILLSILSLGICMMLDIGRNDKMDDANGKRLVITVPQVNVEK